MRKLASIQRVNTVEPIEGADAIERIRVLGWWVVTRKGEYQPGDVCVYCEIDSLMPDRPEFEFLRERSNMRIKTAKLRGQVSQGICFPLSILPEHLAGSIDETQEGRDVTEALGIVKYEPPVNPSLDGQVKGAFPGWISKTDETRVQTLEGLLERHRGKAFWYTEKLDGSSCTAYFKDGEFGVCSRNIDFLESESNLFWRAARAHGVEEKLKAYGGDIAIQAELVGPGVQGNKLKLSELKLLVFNIFDVAEGRYLNHAEMVNAADILHLEMVPHLGDLVLDHTVDQLVELATVKSTINPQAEAEGLVFRPYVEATDPEIGRLSFKAINPRFLLKFDA